MLVYSFMTEVTSQSIFSINIELEIVYCALRFGFLTRHLQKSKWMIEQYKMGKHSFGLPIIARAYIKQIAFFYTIRDKHFLALVQKSWVGEQFQEKVIYTKRIYLSTWSVILYLLS